MEQIFQIVKKKILFLFLFLLLISFVSGLETFQQNQDVKLCREVRSNGALPSSATCNVTITYSNGTKLIDFLRMDDLADQFCFNLTSTHTSIKGTYPYAITCSDATDNDTIRSEYLINLGGIEPTQSRTDAATRTIWIFFGLALITFISLFLIKKTPFKLSLFLIMIWFILMGINASYISIQDEVINSSMENFLSFFLVTSYWANYAIFFIIIVIWIITFIVNMMGKHTETLEKNYGP